MKLQIENVTEDKKKRIIKCAMEEFATKGFDNASTNQIILKAGISKGAIFQYFMNKEYMFYYIFDYSQEQINTYIIEKVDYSNPDLLVRIESYMDQMVNLLEDYPDTMNFIIKAKNEENREIKEEIKKRKSEVVNGLQDKIIKDIDISLFKNSADLDKVLFIVYTTLEKIIDLGIKDKDDKTQTHNNIKEYLNYFRKLFYN